MYVRSAADDQVVPGRRFGEDVGILEAQQRNLAEQPARHLMRLNIDVGGFEARRIIERLVAEEQNDLLKG